MLDGLAQRFFLGLPQRGGRLPVEARRIFAIGAEHMGEERRRHFVMLDIGCVGMFANRTGRHLVGKPGVAFGIAGGEFGGGARAQPLDRGADDDVRQRHPFGGADDGRDEAHVTTPFILSTIFSENRPPLALATGHSALPAPVRPSEKVQMVSTQPELPVRCCTRKAPEIRIDSETAMAPSASRYKMVMQNPASVG